MSFHLSLISECLLGSILCNGDSAMTGCPAWSYRERKRACVWMKDSNGVINRTCNVPRRFNNLDTYLDKITLKDLLEYSDTSGDECVKMYGSTICLCSLEMCNYECSAKNCKDVDDYCIANGKIVNDLLGPGAQRCQHRCKRRAWPPEITTEKYTEMATDKVTPIMTISHTNKTTNKPTTFTVWITGRMLKRHPVKLPFNASF